MSTFYRSIARLLYILDLAALVAIVLTLGKAVLRWPDA